VRVVGLPETTAVDRVRRSTRGPLLAAAVLIAAGAALVLFSNRDMYLFQDEWDFITTRHGFSALDLFAPQNQNWLTTTVLGYQALVAIFGIGDYLPYRLVPALLMAAIGALTYLYARRHIGKWWALLPAALIVVNPAAEIVIWPFQMGQLISLACGLGALVLLDSEVGGRWRAVSVSGLLVLGAASSSLGVPLAAVVAYDRLLRRGRRIEVLYVLPAAVAYVVWYLKYGRLSPYDNHLGWAQLNAAVQRSVEIATGHVRFFLGLTRVAPGAVVSRLGLIGLLVLVCWHAFGPRAEGRTRMLAIAFGLATYWLLLAWGRATTPGVETDARYIFGTQAFLVLLAIQLAQPVAAALRDVRIPGRRPGLVALVAGVAVVLVTAQAVRSNSKLERDDGYLFRVQGQAMRGQIAALDVLTDKQRRVAPFVLNGLTLAFPRPTELIYKYLHTPADDQVQALVAGLSRAEAEYADRRLLILFSQPLSAGTPKPSVGSARPTVTPLPGAGVRVKTAGRGCVRMLGPTNTSSADVALPPRGVVIRNAGGGLGEASARRFAAEWTGPARLEIAPSTALVVRVQPDRSTVPWHLRASGQHMVICTLA
jgi:hypothetical protein